jgi:hypothetical protein
MPDRGSGDFGDFNEVSLWLFWISAKVHASVFADLPSFLLALSRHNQRHKTTRRKDEPPHQNEDNGTAMQRSQNNSHTASTPRFFVTIHALQNSSKMIAA